VDVGVPIDQHDGSPSWHATQFECHRRARPGDLDEEGTVNDHRNGRNKSGHDKVGEST
jgi:hypothetical protein